MELKEALAQLDPSDSSLWTSNGAPMVDEVNKLVDVKVSRQDIIDAAPKFSREHRVIGDEELPEFDPFGDNEVDLEPNEDLGPAYKLEALEPVDPAEYYRNLMSLSKEDAIIAADGLTDYIDLLDKAKHNIEQMIRKAQQNLANTKNFVAVRTPRNQNQKNIMAHIRSQNALREQRAASISKIKEDYGIDKRTNLDPRAPIDRAFDKKRGFGLKRPGS